MIDLKKCNYITGDTISVSYGLSTIIKFLETAGRNSIFIGKKESNIKSFMSISKFEYKDKYGFEKILTDKGNLFRVDLIVVDLWYINKVSSVMEYKLILDKTGIDYIIITDKYHYKDTDDIFVYKIEKETIDTNNYLSGSKYWISELIGGWKSTIDDLILSYRRDKKIDDIFGE